MDRRNSHLLLLLQAKSQRSNRNNKVCLSIYIGDRISQKKPLEHCLKTVILLGLDPTTRQRLYRLTHIVCNFNKIGILLNDLFSFVVCFRFKCFFKKRSAFLLFTSNQLNLYIRRNFKL